jgi:hypothetical protein
VRQVTIKQMFSSTTGGRRTTTFRTRAGADVLQTTTFRTGRGADVPQTTTFRTRVGADVPQTTSFRTRGGADVPQTTGRPEEELDISDDCQIIASPKQKSSNESLTDTSGPDQMTNESDVRFSNKSSPTCDVGESADLQAIADSRIVEFFVENKIPVQVRMFLGQKFFMFLSVFQMLIF